MARMPSNPFEMGSSGVSKDQVDWNHYGYLTTDNGSTPDPFAETKAGDGCVATTNPFEPVQTGVQKPGMGSIGYTRGGSTGDGNYFDMGGPPPPPGWGYHQDPNTGQETYTPPPTTYQPPPQDGIGGTDWANSLYNQNAQWGVQAYGNQRGWDSLSAKGQWLGRLAPTLYNQYAVASATNPNLNAIDYYNSMSPTIDNWWGVAQSANYAPMRRWR